MGMDLPIVGSEPVEGAVKLDDIGTIEDKVSDSEVRQALYDVPSTEQGTGRQAGSHRQILGSIKKNQRGHSFPFCTLKRREKKGERS